jgi:hypothetical protein
MSKKEKKGITLLKHLRDNQKYMRYSEIQQFFYNLNHPGNGKCSRGYFCDYIPILYQWMDYDKKTKKYKINKKGKKLLTIDKPIISNEMCIFTEKEKIKYWRKKYLKAVSEKNNYQRQSWKYQGVIRNLISGHGLNPVTEKEIEDAIEYLFVQGYVDEMTSDKKYYTSILLKVVANTQNTELVWEANDQE